MKGMEEEVMGRKLKRRREEKGRQGIGCGSHEEEVMGRNVMGGRRKERREGRRGRGEEGWNGKESEWKGWKGKRVE